jgi:hypothetical protein
MTDGMNTRNRAIADELQSLSATVHEHADALRQIPEIQHTIQQIPEMQNTLHSLQTSINTLVLSFARFENKPLEPNTQPPLLPTPLMASLPTIPHDLSPNLRLPKLELSHFDGTNPLEWLFQADRYFAFHHTPDEQRVDIASFYMSGQALSWFQWLYTHNRLTTWATFSQAMEQRFGPSTFTNHEAALFKLQ